MAVFHTFWYLYGKERLHCQKIYFICVGISTALVACFVDIAIEELSALKYGYLKTGRQIN